MPQTVRDEPLVKPIQIDEGPLLAPLCPWSECRVMAESSSSSPNPNATDKTRQIKSESMPKKKPLLEQERLFLLSAVAAY